MDIKSKERSTSNPSLVCDKSRKSAIPDETFRSSSNSLISPRAKAHVENLGTNVNCIKSRNETDDVSKIKVTVIQPPDKVSNFSDNSGFSEQECDKWEVSFPAPDESGRAVHPCEPPKQSSHLSTQASGIFSKIGKDFSLQLKPQIREIIPNGIYSEPSLNCTPNVVSTSSSKLESSPLSCISFDNLFDPALVTPSVGFLGIADDQFQGRVASSDFKLCPIEGRDVCQKLLNNVLHSEHEKFKPLQQQQHTVEAETPKFRSAFSVAGLTDFGSSTGAVSEMQPNAQGLKDVYTKSTVATVHTLNGISTRVHSSKSDASSVISMMGKCNIQSGSIVREVTLHSDSDKSCDKAVHSISRTNSIADETASTQNSSVTRVLCRSPLSPADHNRHILRATESEKENARRTKPVGQGYDRQACLAQTSDLDKLSKTNTDDISPIFLAMKGKAPKAKKSCGVSAKVPPVFCENSEFSVLRQRVGDEPTSVAGVAEEVASFGSISRPALSSMTIKLPELENVLGIGYKSLDKMDAKTLDRIVLARAQKKQRLETGLHPRTSEGSDQSSVGRNFSVRGRIENPLPLGDNEMISGIRRQRHNHLFEKINDPRLPPVSSSHVDNRSSVDDECFKYSRQRNFGSRNTETAIEVAESTSVKDDVDREKFSSVFSAKAETSVETSVSDQRNLNSLTFSRRPICKAKKSQGYAFGHVRHCQDVLSVLTKSPLDLGSATKHPSSSPGTEALSNLGKGEIWANQNKARKQASSYQRPPIPKASDYSPSSK